MTVFRARCLGRCVLSRLHSGFSNHHGAIFLREFTVMQHWSLTKFSVNNRPARRGVSFNFLRGEFFCYSSQELFPLTVPLGSVLEHEFNRKSTQGKTVFQTLFYCILKCESACIRGLYKQPTFQFIFCQMGNFEIVFSKLSLYLWQSTQWG